MRYHLTLVRTVAIKKSTNSKCWRGCGEKGTLLHGNVNWYSHYERLYAAAAAAPAKSLQSCPTPCDHIDSSPPGSPIRGILQARTLEWVAISFSNAWKWNVKVKSLSHVWLFVTPWTAAYQAPPSMGFSRQEFWSGVPLPSPNVCVTCPFSGLPQTVIIASYLPLCELVTQSCLTLRDPIDCSPPGSSVHGILQARTLEWAAIPFSEGPSQPRDQTLAS